MAVMMLLSKFEKRNAMIRYVLLIVTTALGTVSPGTTMAEYSKEDFAYGHVIEIDGAASVYSLPLPFDVYAETVQENLADVLLFNDDGEVVPHELHHVEAKDEGYRTIRNIPYFPLSGDSDLIEDQPFIEIERNSSGQIVTVHKKSVQGKSRATAYLFDLQGVESYPVTLRLQWKASGAGVMVPITVASSADLLNWRNETEFTLADLEFMGKRLRHGEVKLDRDPGRFLKMVTGPGGEFITITGVQSATEQQQEKMKRSWVGLPLRRDEEGSKTYLKAELPGVLPVDSLQLHFPRSNSLLHTRIEGRSSSEPWRFRAETLFYDLSEGEARLRNKPLLIQKSNVKFFRLEVLQDGMGSHTDPAELQVGYVPHNLVFIARGPSPFVLAFGNGRMKSGGAASIKANFHTLQRDGARSIVRTVDVQDKIALGGEEMLEKEREKPWKKIVLWVVLFGGSVALGAMAWSLTRKANDG
jgi:hypothetical protein